VLNNKNLLIIIIIIIYKSIKMYHILVTPSIEEPIPGWIDNIYGPMGLSIGAGKGILRVMYINKYVCENVIPVDIVVKAVLVVVWKLGLIKYDHQHISAHTFLTVSNYKHKSFFFNLLLNLKKNT